MHVKYENLLNINKDLQNFPNAKLQIVTKQRKAELVKELISYGYNLFGENRVQEAKEKYASIDCSNISLHLIGALQSNKALDALQLFDTIQTIDRPSIVDAIVKILIKKKVKTKNFYIQVNIGEESQKSGVHPSLLNQLYNLCIEKSLNIEGLMCIPPQNMNPEIYFNYLKNLRDSINHNLKLSMGMSNDYKIALEAGSNLIRIGSLIFDE
jgi:pyridoxal phosphate enzyme (YggS family)